MVKAQNEGTIFRGFEAILEGRDARDAPYLTQRICGICSSAHGLAACRALEDAAGLKLTGSAMRTRNLILGLDFMQNHIRQFYMLMLWDWVAPPPQNPFQGGYTRDFRLSPSLTARFREHHWTGVDHARLAHEALTLIGGKIPHNHGIIPGGVSLVPSGEIARELGRRIKKLAAFVEEIYLPDALRLQEAYPDYMQIGRGRPNYLSHGLYTEADNSEYSPAGAVLEGLAAGSALSEIRESVASSWYRGKGGHPLQGKTIPDPDRKGAYSWVKAPRYRGFACQGGPLARQVIKGEHPPGSNSTLERVTARAREALETSRLLRRWLAEINPEEPGYQPFKLPDSGSGVGVTEAMRGPLSHWVTLKGGCIENYQIITPSAWNFSPADEQGTPGPVENALLGTPVEKIDQPVEIGRVIRSFDPCYACTAHVLDPARGIRKTVKILA